MPAKEVKVKVATEEDLSGAEALELKIKKIERQKIQLNIDTNTQKLDETQSRIEKLKQEKANLDVDADDSEIKKIEGEIAQLEQRSLDLELKIETDELQKAKAEVEELDDEEIEIQLRNQSAMEAIDQISQGFDRLKQGASEIGQEMGVMLESAGKQETNKVFLEQAIGADKAASAMNNINTAVQKLPGDDTVLQGLLSQAMAKDASLTADELERMGVAAADYFSAMTYYGKPASEAFQDMNNYLLTGQTAEIERSPILANHIDKLKEGTTIQERSLLLQQALNEEHWGGMSQQDTYNNKLETFNGMIERGQYNLGGMFQEGAKGAMDFLLQLDEGTNGIVGMTIALGGFASPLTDTIMGLGQMATGVKAIKDLGFIKWFKELSFVQKTYKAITSALIPVQYAEGAAGWFSVGWMLVAVAAGIALGLALLYLYNNCEWFREGVDNLGQSLMGLGQWIYNGAIYWLNQLKMTLENLWNYIVTLGGLLPANVNLTGNSIIDTILRVMAFLLTLPMQIGMMFLNIIAKTLGFGDNFTQRMIKAASDAINGFIRYIQQLPDIVLGEFNRVLGLVNDFINSLPSRVWDMGVAIIDALKASLGIGSPGHMYYMVEGEFNRIDNLTKKTRFDTASIGQDMVDSFNPKLNGELEYGRTANSMFEKLNDFMSGNTGDITFNLYGDIDDEKRMNKFVDAVVHRLTFENATAGRTN